MTSDLITRLSKLDAPDNRIDVLVEVATFEPDENFVSARPNAAGTKVVFKTKDGRSETYWAHDYTGSPESRAACIALLRAKEASK